MDLRFNTKSPFTKWIVRDGVLREPFVVVDIGVLGGENIRWHLLGDYLVVHGFDAIEEVVVQLREENAGNPKRMYHAIAAGNVDEEQTFYFNSAGPTSSSFFAQGTDRYRADGSRTEEARTVPIRRLDSLLRDKLIPPADFLKVDVEGFEKDVLLGAATLLRSVLGSEIETNFNMSPSYPVGHFNEIYQLLLPAHLRVFDVNFNRVPRKHFRDALDRKGLADEVDWDQVGAVATLNTLFCRDLIDEADHSEIYPTACEPASVDQLIKTMVIYELHGLSDVAVDTAVRFRESLAERLDVDKAIDLLAERPSAVIYPIKPDGQLKHDHETYLSHIRELERTVLAEAADRSGELAGLFGSLKAEHQAFLSRFLDLSGIAGKQRGAYTAKVGELSATLRAEQEAFVARIRELERERDAWQSALPGHIGRQVLSALVAASERRGAVALGLRLVLGVLRRARRLVRRVFTRPSAPIADGPRSELRQADPTPPQTQRVRLDR